jgi:saccharopine dehydrogenase-like NADP-dependent oxidoreductase
MLQHGARGGAPYAALDKCQAVTFKFGLSDEFIEAIQILRKMGLDPSEKIRVSGVEVSPRDVVAAALPDPATLGDKMTGKTCAGLWVTGASHGLR